MDRIKQRLMLADDDIDDCMFFREALDELSVESTLVTVNDGEELMRFLNAKPGNLPDVLFLDLNMPRKTGHQCLSEIKRNKDLAHLPVVIFSTSFDHSVVNTLYENGAHYYIRKPAEFSMLKEVIRRTISLISSPDKKQPSKEKFVVSSD